MPNQSAGVNAAILSGDLRFSAGGVRVGDLIGAFVRTASVSSNTLTLEVQNADGTFEDVTFTPAGGGGGGSSITSGTADPSGGSSGDAYIQINTSSVITAIWENVSGTWTEYTLPAGGSGADLSDDTPESVTGTVSSAGTSTEASRSDHEHDLVDGAVTQVKLSDGSVHTSKIADGAVTAAKIPNQEIGHVKLGSSVGGQDQAAGRILEADGAGDVRWADKGGGSGGGGAALESIDFPTPDATNVYDIIDHLGVAYQNQPEVVGVAVTWSESVDGDDVSDLWGETTGTYTFRGIENVSDVTNPQSGDVILLPTGGFRHRGATRFGHLRNPDGWVGGPYASEDEANNHVTATNDVSAYAGALQLVTAFTAGTTHYQWTNIVAISPSSALVSRVLGTPTADRLYEIQNFLGELYRVEPRPTGHVATWDDYALLSDVSTLWGENAGTYRWRGETYPGGVANPATGDVIKEPAGHFRHRNSSNAWVHLVDPDDFIGDYNDETAANNHVTAVGQTSLYSHLLHQVATFTAGVAVYVWAKGLDAREVTVDAHAFGGNLAPTDTDVQQVAEKVDGLILGPSLSDDAPEDIGGTAAEGTSGEVSPADHVHRLPIDNTLEFDAANEQFGVNVQDVIEHLQERIRYFTSSTNYSSDAGASVGQAYNTSQYRRLITKVEVNFDPLAGADAFLVRLVELESNNEIKAKLFTSNTRRGPFGAGAGVRAFTFHDAAGDVGVTIDGGIRLGILLSRLEDDSDSAVGALHGSEASGSPNETYDDASDDFDLDNGIVYQHIDPAVGASTHSHDTQIRGNIKIFYTLILDHGNLVGDGNVNAAHIDSESAADGEVLTADGSGGAAWEAAAGGGGTDDQTAAEVTVDTANFSSNLTAADDTVQAALETIDGFTQYQGNWQQAAWPAGVIVRRSGIPYLSLVNNNTEIPTPGATQWTGLAEGFIYRGEAPVAATNYNYGQVVLEPDTDVYYYFTSTISASVARADIATHANFQAISGETGHSPRVGSGNAFPTTPAPLAGDIFFFNADVASGLDWKDTDGTTDLTAATGGDMARFDGTDWIKVINLVGGGGAADPARVVLADATGVSNTAGPHEIALTEAMVARQLITFFMHTTSTTSPDGIGYLLSDDILALTAEATAPSDAENSLPAVIANYGAASFSQQSGNYFVYRKDDSTLWVRPTRLAAHSLTITATPLGGGAGTNEQTGGSGVLTRVNIHQPPSDPFELTTTGTGSALSVGNENQIFFTAVEKARVERCVIILRIDDTFNIKADISKEEMDRLPDITELRPDPIVGTDESGVIYLSGRTQISADSREPQLTNPTWAYIDFRRLASRYGICIGFTDDSTGLRWRSLRTYCNSDVDIAVVSAGMYHV